MVQDAIEVNRLLGEARRDPVASDALFDRIYADLQRLARAQLRRTPATLDTTEVVHEVYFRLFDAKTLSVEDRNHLYSLAARAMRQLLVDRFRKRVAQKRGAGAVVVTWNDEAHALGRGIDEDILALDEALSELATLSPRMAKVVEYRFFGGLTQDEIGETLGVTSRTVRTEWQKARAWLAHRLGPSVSS